MGMGGGFVLLLYLVIFGGTEQMSAQGQNLLFFIPIVIISLFFHIRNRLVDFKTALLCGICGLPAVYLGYLTAISISGSLLKKLFAAFIIAAGLKDLFKRRPPNS